MKTKEKLAARLVAYIFGLFIMTMGIAVSVKSDLGVSPVSSIPYTFTCICGFEMGNATIVLHSALVVLQILLLRRKFKWINLLQVPVGVVFGKFTTLSNLLMDYLPATDNLLVRLLMILLSSLLIAVGIFFYLPADIMPLAGEGVIQAISEVTGIRISNAKILFDVSMVGISAVLCFLCLHSIASVGIGTLIAAVCVGMFLGMLNRIKGKALPDGGN